MTKDKPKITQKDLDYYKNKWLDTLAELNRLKDAIRNVLELAKIPIHDHPDDD